MGREDYNALSGQIGKQVAKTHPLFRVETGGRFVYDEHLGIIEQSLGDLLTGLIPSYQSILIVFDPLQTDHTQVQQKVQQAVQAIPWVAQDSVRRVWPDTLAIDVTEQRTEAEWAKGGLVNPHGVLFFPERDTYPKGLPVFDGPTGTERNLTEAYQMAKAIIEPLQLQIQEIHMDSRRAISLKLNNGIDVILGREETRTRLERFARVYRKLLVQRVNDIARVDMRYSNGLAVGWRTPHTS